MALHDSLRELVAVRGAGVVDEAEELRGALDDFLAEEEATLGELNLLVDAVRLGALRRVLDVLDHGADPEAAVRQAGAALARDRGTDDPTRSCWALAALGFALGRVDESLVRTFRADAGTMPAPTPPPPPPGPAPQPAPPPPPGPGAPTSTTGGIPATPVLDPTASPQPPAPQPPAPQPPAPVPPPPLPVVPQERTTRAGTFLLVVLVALILGGLVAAGVILLGSDDEPTASDEPTDSPSVSDDGPRRKPPLVSKDEMLVPYLDESGAWVVYRVDVGGGYEAVTDGPVDVLPTISPDRRTMTYDVGPAPLTLYRVNLASGETEPFFAEDGPCNHALRPGWSPDGKRVAVACTGDDKLPDGLWLARSDGSDPELLLDDTLVRGSPTWVSDTRIVYGRQDNAAEDARLTFWTLDVDERVPTQLDVGLESTLQLTHVDWSEEAGRLLFLVSPPGEEEVGDVWTMDADGSNPSQLAEGRFAHPVWSPDGQSIGVTMEMGGSEVLAYIPLDDPDQPVVVADAPPGEVGVPVWGTR